MTQRILVADDISNVGLDVLRGAGHQVLARAGIDRAALLKSLPDVDALLVRSRTRVTAELMDAAPKLRLVGRAGFGMDTIDIAEATRRGVAVFHSPEGNSTTAAEFAVGLLFSLARHIPRADAAMRAGRWEKRRYRGVEISGKTLGVIGMGNVGREVVERAAALRMRVLVHDPGKEPAAVRAAGGEPADWEELLSTSDFLTVHVASGEETRGLIDDDAFGRMRDGVRLINCSRGGVVSEAALVRAVRSGRVAGAAVDVFDEEPPWGSELLALPQVILTPHLVASTFEAQISVAVTLAERVRDFFELGALDGLVNQDVAGRLRPAE